MTGAGAVQSRFENGRGRGQPEAADYSVALQELWFSLARREWTTLAFVPASSAVSAMPLARKLSAIGAVFRGAAVGVRDGTSLDLAGAAALALELQTSNTSWTSMGTGARKPGSDESTRTLVALDPVIDNPMSIPVALAADAVLVVIARRVTTRASAERTIEQIGRERILGAVLIGGR